MGPLIACSVLALAVIIERFLALRQARRQATAFLADFDRLVKAHDWDAARDLCRGAATPLAAMMLAGMQRFEEMRGEVNPAFVHEQVNAAIDEQGKFVVDELETHLGLLATAATISPLLGFAGTVTGMINAFNAIAGSNDISVGLVAAGISEALITTAAGLMIAIPSVVAYNYYTKQVETLTLTMEGSANRLLSTLTRSLIASHSPNPQP
jgi:biopolymer transport protein ExbB